MGQRTVLATLELAKRCTYTAVGEAASGNLGAANLKHEQPRRRLRLTNLAQAIVTVFIGDALAAVQDTGIASYGWWFPLYCTATRNATQELFLGPSEASVQSSGTAAWYSGSLPFWKSLDNDRARFPRRHSWIEQPGQRTDPWARYVITDPTNPDGFIDLGFLVPHPGYVPTHPILAQPDAGLSEEVRESRGVTGSRRRQRRPRERLRSFVLQATGVNCRQEVEENWQGLIETIGVSETLILLEDADATTRTMNRIIYGDLEGEPEKVTLPQPFQRAQLTINMREKL